LGFRVAEHQPAEEQGVSRIVSVKFHKAVEHLPPEHLRPLVNVQGADVE
jgi:hypothetical protein